MVQKKRTWRIGPGKILGMDVVPCAYCKQPYAIQTMEISELGYRCYSCSQLCQISQHEATRREQLEAQNRSVETWAWFTGYWRVHWSCTACGERLWVSPGLSMSLPPHFISCINCNADIRSNFLMRSNWMLRFLLRISIVLAIGLALWEKQGFDVATILLNLFYAFVGTAILAPAATLVLDLVRPKPSLDSE